MANKTELSFVERRRIELDKRRAEAVKKKPSKSDKDMEKFIRSMIDKGHTCLKKGGCNKTCAACNSARL